MTRQGVVAGGSIAALTAVEMLRMEEFDGRITVLTDEDVPPYTRVPLSKGVLAGTGSIDDIVLAPLAAEVDLRLKAPATALDPDTRTVHTPRRARVLRRAGDRHRRTGPPAGPTRPGRAGAALPDRRHPAARGAAGRVVGARHPSRIRGDAGAGTAGECSVG